MEWWQRGIVYQVYPRSFQDSNGDGTGDLPGITARLDHLAWLGVDAVWISPIFPSPMADFGYDVADYCDIDKLFGTMADFEALRDRAHALGLKLILDFVPNHSSDQHSWFQASRRRQDGKDDWYIWRNPAAAGGPPNNWLAHFGGPAWTYDPVRAQFYCHSFLPSQPDLNWRNPGLRAAMLDVLRFWLERGVDGFRVDVMWLMIKDDKFRDNPVNLAWRPSQRPFESLIPLYTADRPEVHAIVADMRAVLDQFDHRVLIGEIYLPIDRLVTYYGRNGIGAQLPFNFHLLQLQDWSAPALADLITRYDAALPPGAWPNWVLGNHDRPRVATRLGEPQARIAAMLLLTLRGTPTLYMGDELGMVDTPIPQDAIRDPAERRQPGQGQGRDPVRTPFPWDDTPGRGFTTGTPWLPFGADRPLSAQRDDPASMLSLHRRLIALRREHEALAIGAISDVAAHGAILRYTRTSGDARFEIVLNTSGETAELDTTGGTVLADTTNPETYALAPGKLGLLPHQGLIIRP
jgi:alpha-glucosidase